MDASPAPSAPNASPSGTGERSQTTATRDDPNARAHASAGRPARRPRPGRQSTPPSPPPTPRSRRRPAGSRPARPARRSSPRTPRSGSAGGARPSCSSSCFSLPDSSSSSVDSTSGFGSRSPRCRSPASRRRRSPTIRTASTASPGRSGSPSTRAVIGSTSPRPRASAWSGSSTARELRSASSSRRPRPARSTRPSTWLSTRPTATST